MAGIRIAGVWEKKNPQGKVYYEGTWGNAILRIYGNDYKKTERDPDCVVYLSEKPKEDKRPGQRLAQAQAAPFQKKSPITPKPEAQIKPKEEEVPDWMNEPFPDQEYPPETGPNY